MDASLKLRDEVELQVAGDRFVIVGAKGSTVILSPEESILLRAFVGGVTFVEQGVIRK